MKAFGLAPEIEIQDHFELWDMNLEAMQVFSACSDDWKMTLQGRYKSIDKLALGVVMEMMGVTNRKEMLTDIIAMQNAALRVINNG